MIIFELILGNRNEVIIKNFRVDSKREKVNRTHIYNKINGTNHKEKISI